MFAIFAMSLAFFNVAAGRKLFGLTTSTQVGRVFFALASAGAATLLFKQDAIYFAGLAILLYLWRLRSWGKYFTAVHGRPYEMEGLIDRISDKIWPMIPQTAMEWRLKATLGMSIRMMAIIPAIAFSAIYMGNYFGVITALAFPLMGIAYFIGGIPNENKYSIMVAEAICGAVIAAMLWG